jgi:hypothetical protein
MAAVTVNLDFKDSRPERFRVVLDDDHICGWEHLDQGEIVESRSSAGFSGPLATNDRVLSGIREPRQRRFRSSPRTEHDVRRGER